MCERPVYVPLNESVIELLKKSKHYLHQSYYIGYVITYKLFGCLLLYFHICKYRKLYIVNFVMFYSYCSKTICSQYFTQHARLYSAIKIWNVNRRYLVWLNRIARIRLHQRAKLIRLIKWSRSYWFSEKLLT